MTPNPTVTSSTTTQTQAKPSSANDAVVANTKPSQPPHPVHLPFSFEISAALSPIVDSGGGGRRRVRGDTKRGDGGGPGYECAYGGCENRGGGKGIWDVFEEGAFLWGGLLFVQSCTRRVHVLPRWLLAHLTFATSAFGGHGLMSTIQTTQSLISEYKSSTLSLYRMSWLYFVSCHFLFSSQPSPLCPSQIF